MDTFNKRIIESFDTNRFPFKEIFADHLEMSCENLSSLHQHLPDFSPNEVVTVDNDQNQKIYDHLYKIDQGYNFDNGVFKPGKFLTVFQDFVNFIADKYFEEDLVYQKKPTLRVMFPNNKAVGGWHRDREYNHPIEEINMWVPITDASNTNTIWTESSFDKLDYSPVNIDYGNFLIFDSGLMHGNQINIENKTRISFDFRVIPKSLYKENNESSFSQNIDFKINEYYAVTNLGNINNKTKKDKL